MFKLFFFIYINLLTLSAHSGFELTVENIEFRLNTDGQQIQAITYDLSNMFSPAWSKVSADIPGNTAREYYLVDPIPPASQDIAVSAKKPVPPKTNSACYTLLPRNGVKCLDHEPEDLYNTNFKHSDLNFKKPADFKDHGIKSMTRETDNYARKQNITIKKNFLDHLKNGVVGAEGIGINYHKQGRFLHSFRVSPQSPSYLYPFPVTEISKIILTKENLVGPVSDTQLFELQTCIFKDLQKSGVLVFIPDLLSSESLFPFGTVTNVEQPSIDQKIKLTLAIPKNTIRKMHIVSFHDYTIKCKKMYNEWERRYNKNENLPKSSLPENFSPLVYILKALSTHRTGKYDVFVGEGNLQSST